MSQNNNRQKPLESLALRWASPELLQSRIPTYQTDLWALGVTFFEVFSDGLTPYRHIRNDELIPKLLSNEIKPKLILQGEIKSLVAKQFEPEEVRWSTEET